MARLSYPGHIRKRARGKYQLVVTIDGRQHYRTIEAASKGEAADAITTWHAELAGSQEKATRGVPINWTMGDLLGDWLDNVVPRTSEATQKQYASFANRVRYYLEHVLRTDPRVADFRGAECTLFLDWRARTTFTRRGVPGASRCSPRSQQKERNQLHLLFERAMALEIIDGNPVGRTDAPKVRDREPVLITDDQVGDLESEMSDAMRKLYIVVLDQTAVRCGSEALWLRWEDVDWAGGEHGFLWIWNDPESSSGHTTKGGRGRWIPMTAKLRGRLKSHELAFRMKLYGNERSPWIFHNTRSRKRYTAGDRVGSFYRAFMAAAKRAGLPEGLHQHDLRHRRITRWVAEGRELATVQKAAGHSDIRTTMGYVHLARKDLEGLVSEQAPAIDLESLVSLLQSDDSGIREAAQALISQLRKEA